MRSAIFSIVLSIVTAWVMGRPAPPPPITVCLYSVTSGTLGRTTAMLASEASSADFTAAATLSGHADSPRETVYVVWTDPRYLAVSDPAISSAPLMTKDATAPACAGRTDWILVGIEGRPSSAAP
ncbi:MAG TPA: hypothetical protein VLC48_04635 [Gemmatimonadota bacterium]|nr:hypothetical protein [Gemmatimonadota bacterium]